MNWFLCSFSHLPHFFIIKMETVIAHKKREFRVKTAYPIFSQVRSSVARSHCSYINSLDYFTWLYGFNKRISSKFYVLFRNYYDGCSSLFTRDGREAL